jgi:hypothetical protein
MEGSDYTDTREPNMLRAVHYRTVFWTKRLTSMNDAKTENNNYF